MYGCSMDNAVLTVISAMLLNQIMHFGILQYMNKLLKSTIHLQVGMCTTYAYSVRI